MEAVAVPQGVLPADENVRELLKKTKLIPAEKRTPKGKLLSSNMIANVKQKDLCFAIHVVEFGDIKAETSKTRNLKINSSAWYLYHENVSFEEFTGQRIYGSRNVIVLFLHLNAIGFSTDELTAVDEVFANVHYEAAVVKKIAANIQNLLSVLKIIAVATVGPPKEKKNVIVWGSGVITNVPIPSDVHLAGYYNSKQPTDNTTPPTNKQRIGSELALDNEGRYVWDVSIGIPVHKIKEIQYSSSTGTVEAKEVDKQNAYAMFNLMPWPVDIKDPKSNLVPRILLGFPLASDPWSKLFVGGGIGLPKYMAGSQFFMGVVFNRVSKPSTLTAGTSASEAQLQNDSHLQTEKKFLLGINVAVKSVMDKLLNK